MNTDRKEEARLIRVMKDSDDDAEAREAFLQLLRMTISGQFRLAFSYLGDIRKAEEAVWKSYIYVRKNIRKLTAPKMFDRWLRTITLANCYCCAAQSDGSGIHAEKMKAPLDALSVSEREAVLFAFSAGMGIDEIARMMSVSRHHAAWYLRNGKSKMRKCVGSMDGFW